MAAENKKVIVVCGATGAQGGSVVRYLLQDRKYKVRGITRDAISSKAKELAAKGVEVVQANMKNKEELLNALEGAYGFFALTQFWDPESTHQETEIGKTLVEAAKESGVKHFVWSTLANVKEISNDKWKVPHFTDKAEVDKFVLGAGFQYSTFVVPAFYFSNFSGFFPPRNDNGTLVFTVPMPPKNRLAAFDVDDTGESVLNAFNNPTEWDRKYIPLAGSNMPIEDYVRTFTEVTGKPARLESPSLEEFAKVGGDEMSQMFGWFNEYGYFGNFDLELGKRGSPSLKTFEQWLKKTGWTGSK